MSYEARARKKEKRAFKRFGKPCIYWKGSRDDGNAGDRVGTAGPVPLGMICLFDAAPTEAKRKAHGVRPEARAIIEFQTDEYNKKVGKADFENDRVEYQGKLYKFDERVPAPHIWNGLLTPSVGLVEV